MDSNAALSPTIVKFAERCPAEDRRGVLAYCCYLTLKDRQLRSAEVDFVRALADALGADPELPAHLTGKARRGSLRVKMPASEAARSLLFQVAIEGASIDGQLDDREDNAIRTLAGQLGIASETVDAQLAHLTLVEPAAALQETSPSESEQPQGFFAGLVKWFTDNLVIDDYEAKLYEPGALAGARKFGEVEFTRRKSGRVEFEVELKHLSTPLPEVLTVHIAGRQVCEVRPTAARFEQRFDFDEANNPLPEIVEGTEVQLHNAGEVMFRGEFQLD